MTAGISLNPLDDLVALCDDTMRRSGQPGFNCVQVIVFEGSVERERLARSVDDLARRHPLTTARLGRFWRAWRPKWIIQPAASIPVDYAQDQTSPLDPVSLAADVLNQPLNPRCDPPVQVFLRRGRASGDVLVLKWSHVLADARGGDFLLRELGRIYEHGPGIDYRAAPLRPDRLCIPLAPPWSLVRLRRGRGLFRLWRGCPAGGVRLRGIALSDQESRRIHQTAARVAGFGRMPVFLLAAYLCALRQEAVNAGCQDALLRTCWPVGLREGVPPESLTANEYGVLHIECPVREAAEVSVLVDRLTRDIVLQLGRGEHRRFWQTGRWFRLASYPFLRVVNRNSRLFFRGPAVSADFRYRGRLLDGARSWGGIPIAGGLSATLCWPEKPVAIGVSETAGRFYIGATWLEGAIAQDVIERLMAGFRRELLGGDQAAG